MSFPNPGNYGTDPSDFSGRDYALGRYYYGDGGGDGDGGGGGGRGCGSDGAFGCFLLSLVFLVPMFLLWLVIQAFTLLNG